MHKNRAGALRPRHDLIICVFVSTPTIDREPYFKGETAGETEHHFSQVYATFAASPRKRKSPENTTFSGLSTVFGWWR